MSSPLLEFHLFPLLPSELRLKIWTLILSTPRTVTLNCIRKKIDCEGRYPERRFVESFTSTTPIPSLLHVCRETRFEALSYYTPYFKTSTSPQCTYLSLSLDTITCPDSLLEYMPSIERRSIRTLILDVKDTAYFGHFNMPVIKEMKELKELTLLTMEGDIYGWNRGNMYLETIKRDFEMERMGDPGWVCPKVNILSKETGEGLADIEGGAMIPGWVHSDGYPDMAPWNE